MCGIAGFLSKNGEATPIGETMLAMLEALGCRGPDSSGVAIWNADESDAWIARVKLGEGDTNNDAVAQLVLQAAGQVRDAERIGAYLRLTLDGGIDVAAWTHAVEKAADAVEVVSLGRNLEIIKEVGSPTDLDRAFGIAAMRGTHAIGHTRLSTESRIDLSHSQPFWAHGLPDIASVHNGHITNYHRLRRIYEGRGTHFYTENDSEIIGIYLRDRIERGDDFETALHRCTHDFDGSYCFLAATSTQFALVKDGFSFKPLVVAENDEWIAVASEEIALRRALGDNFSAREPAASSIQLWNLPQAALV